MLPSIKYIKKLVGIFEESELSEFEVSFLGRKVLMKKGSCGVGHKSPQNIETKVIETRVLEKEDGKQNSLEEESNYVEIKSPMVGTFYAAPSPDAEPYVSLNQKINVGQIVCIIEAMKLMNDIESEYKGVVKEILVENGTAVEYGTPLFGVEVEK